MLECSCFSARAAVLELRGCFSGAVPSRAQVDVSLYVGDDPTYSLTRQYLTNHGWHHLAKLTHLAPGTKYSYRVGASGEWSEVFTFRTEEANNGQTLAISIFGDLGYQNSTARPMQLGVDGLFKKWSASSTYEGLRK